jgi:integrase/recombinase XerD
VFGFLISDSSRLVFTGGIGPPVIALWLGREDPATTHQYIEADLLMKEKALRRLQPPKERLAWFKPRADLLNFLDSL